MTPFRIVVFATSNLLMGKGKAPVRRSYGYVGSNNTGDPFIFHGMHAARQAALNYLLRPETEQVQIRTNQDNRIFTFYKSQLHKYTGQSQLPFQGE